MKEFRKKHGLSQADIVRLLGYNNKANVSHCENSDTISQKYILALKALVESMQLMTEKINFLIEYKSFQFEKSELIFARKNSIVRRIYSNNHLQIINFAREIDRDFIIRDDKLYKYEIIVF